VRGIIMCIIIIGTMLSTPTTTRGRCLHWLTSRPRLPARHWLPATNPKKVRGFGFVHIEADVTDQVGIVRFRNQVVAAE
jgi:hypothetical protein